MKSSRHPANKPFFHALALVESASVGPGSRVWPFTHVMKGARIGADCNIGEHCFIESKARIGDRCTVKNGVAVWEGVTLADDVFVGPYAVFTNDLFPISRKRPAKLVPTKVLSGACIGANATIVCGITIGRNAFVGAGSVVTCDVPDHGFVYGNPARLRGYLCACRMKLALEDGKARCARCRSRFSLRGRTLTRLGR